MSANYLPNLNTYTDLKPFRFWCQKVLPLAYDDSLSYYELLNKVVDYLNKTMEDVTLSIEDVQKLHTAYEQLETYVNDYFDNLDVQEEINTKLDSLVEDGTIHDIFNPDVEAILSVANQAASDAIEAIPSNVTAWLNTHVTPETEILLDESLTIEGAAADAKATGDQIRALKSELNYLDKYLDVQIVVTQKAGEYIPFNITKGQKFIITTVDGSEFPSARVNCYNASKQQVDYFNVTSETQNPREITWIKDDAVAYVGLLDDVAKPIVVSDQEYSDIGEIIAEINADITGVNSRITPIVQGLENYSDGNQITELHDGYISPSGLQSTGNYYYTNSIPVAPGQSLSFWKTDSNEIVNFQARFLTAYNSSGSAVEAKGGTYLTAYVVPEDIYSIVISFSNSIVNPMVVFGVARPEQYTQTKNDLYVATDDFIDGAVNGEYQRGRSNEELKSGVLYYLDEKEEVCYCKPYNLSTAKIILYFNGNESTTGSSACFVDFANGTFGFYRAFGVYNRNNLVVEKSTALTMTVDADHEYCIEYKRLSTAPGYTLTLTDMMTLETETTNTTNNVNGWGEIGYDNIDVTVNGIKRLTTLPKNPYVLIIGDSYAEGGTIWSDRDKRWCYLLGEAVGRFAINGQGGARSDHMESWIDNYLFDVFNPKYVIVETGTNEQATAYFTRNLTNIITKIKAIGAVPILCTVPVTAAKPTPSELNDFVINSGLPYIDICRALTVNGDRTTQNLNYFLADEIHPNLAGHERIYEMAKINVPELFRNIAL